MTAMRLVQRQFQPGRSWYSLVRISDDRVAQGGLRSVEEAEEWAKAEGHTIVDSPGRRLKRATAEATKIPGGAAVPAAAAPPGQSPEGKEETRARTGQTIESAHPGGAVSASAPASSPSGPTPAMLRYLPPARLLKEAAPCCIAARALDRHDRWPVGECGPTCLRRAARRAS